MTGVIAERWLYDFLVYVYVLSLLFAFAGLIKPNPRASRISYALLFSIWGIELTFIVIQVKQSFPSVAEIDPFLLYTWSLITFTLFYQRYMKMDIFLFCVNMVGFIVLAIQLFVVRDGPIASEIIMLSELIFVHITLAVIGYVAFSLSSISAFLYYIASFLLKRKKWNRFLLQIPSLGLLQSFSNTSLLVGLLCLGISTILGGIWAIQMVDLKVWFDPKILGSLMVLFIYSLILWQWQKVGWHGKRLAWWNGFAVLMMIGNILISKSSYSFHYWI